MFSGVHALMLRMLREDALRIRAHFSRFGFLILTVFFLGTTYFSSMMRSAAGRDYFRGLIFLDMMFLLTLGLGVYSSAISEEREQGTLGLLKMTGVSRLAILLGKSTSWLLLTLVFLSLQIPFVALAVTMGGVDFSQIVAAVLSLGAFSVLLCNFGLFCSLYCSTTKSSSFMTGSWVTAYFLGPGIFGGILKTLSNIDSGGLLARILNPFIVLCEFIEQTMVSVQLFRIQTTGFEESFLSIQVVSNLVGGACFFGLSWWLFEKLTLNLEPEVVRIAPVSVSSPFRKAKQAAKRTSRRVWTNPFIWQEFQFQAKGSYGWWLRFLVPPTITITLNGVGGILAYMMRQNTGFSPPSNLWQDIFESSLFTLLSITYLYAAVEALFVSARLFGNEYREGTWSTLAILPRNLRTIAYSKVLGELIALSPHFFWLVFCIAVGWLGAQDAFLLGGIQDLEEMAYFIYSIFLMFASHLLLWHLIAWFSVHLKRGAIGLGMMTFILGFITTMIGMSLVPLVLTILDLRIDENLMSVLMYGSIAGLETALILLLHEWTIWRIRRIGRLGGD